MRVSPGRVNASAGRLTAYHRLRLEVSAFGTAQSQQRVTELNFRSGTRQF
jgi:hypothetical protein